VRAFLVQKLRVSYFYCLFLNRENELAVSVAILS
jgi:hypothetical protein